MTLGQEICLLGLTIAPVFQVGPGRRPNIRPFRVGTPVAGPIFGPLGGQDARHLSWVDFSCDQILLVVAFESREKIMRLSALNSL